MIRGRRRRRSSRSGGSLAGDPMDLFLDAITNALGVIMFILLMVVIFGRAGDAPDPTDASASQVQAMRNTIKDLEARLDAMPPRGDPALAAKYKAARERFERSEAEVTELRSRLQTARDELAAAASAVRQQDTVVKQLEAATPMPVKAGQGGVGFIRVSRFTADSRRPVHLLVNDGKVQRQRLTAADKRVAPPSDGQPVGDQAAAVALVRELLGDSVPDQQRVEILVWSGSFREAKLVEKALLQLGYDWNILPIPAGQSIELSEGGGVQ